MGQQSICCGKMSSLSSVNHINLSSSVGPKLEANCCLGRTSSRIYRAIILGYIQIKQKVLEFFLYGPKGHKNVDNHFRHGLECVEGGMDKDHVLKIGQRKMFGNH